MYVCVYACMARVKVQIIPPCGAWGEGAVFQNTAVVLLLALSVLNTDN